MGQVVDLNPNVQAMKTHFDDIVHKFRNGEAIFISVVVLLKDGQVYNAACGEPDEHVAALVGAMEMIKHEIM